MKSILFTLLCISLGGCAANIYRAKVDSTTCESVIATECNDPKPNPDRIRLCGSAFANRDDFEEAATHYCAKPTLRNCALQCCDVECAPEAAAWPAASTPAPAAAAAPGIADDVPMPPPPPPVPAPAPAPAAITPTPVPAAN